MTRPEIEQPAAGIPQVDLSDQLTERLAQLGQEHCLFTRNGEWFALTIQAAREVLIDELPAPVPHAPSLLAGVINLRGEVLPLVHFDALMHFEPRPMLPEDQILVLHRDNVRMGLIVDRVREVRPIPPQEIRPLTDASLQRPHVRGVWQWATAPVLVLDPDSLTRAAVEETRKGFESFRLSAATSVPTETA